MFSELEINPLLGWLVCVLSAACNMPRQLHWAPTASLVLCPLSLTLSEHAVCGGHGGHHVCVTNATQGSGVQRIALQGEGVGQWFSTFLKL